MYKKFFLEKEINKGILFLIYVFCELFDWYNSLKCKYNGEYGWVIWNSLSFDF